MDPIRIFIVGTAGSGKSTLTQAFKLWMDSQGYNAITVNLDPGVEELGYAPDVDVRDWVSVKDVMAERGLGPNGAQIACADIAALQFPKISTVIEGFRADYVLIDTPGQIELFAFREASSVFLNAFSTDRNIIIFVLDPTVARNTAGLVSLLMLSSSIQFRFSAPMDLVLGKSDLLDDEELERILEHCSNPESLLFALGEAGMDMRAVAATEFLKAMEALGVMHAPKPVSGIEMSGIEDIYNSIQQAFFGGEDLASD
ncbi:MAG: ATP/GTP-binding protein [Candidatus Thermoplasmatota archaeon]|nr:GTPase [Euryarchaeota archaeon]MBU4032020.1 ATP/GTP-binding protein [Candidatus Thermoplasmatota archaeon]MBU4071631.1 ATP/GTP-binding protein [Candidatus Thermoplasmatota archaeon]MBU4143891.1 ATP/GTP-binding protein [Candidatus Thermoplasmatota archaeon]MBU4592500.1 ATP/GTP-binding protein [Candidatus Thermoplasmatota archaeon]